MSPTEKKQVIRHDHPKLSISHQCRLVKLSRSAFYYEPVGIDDETLAVLTAIDKAFTRYPFFGSRQIIAYLRREGIRVGRHRVRCADITFVPVLHGFLYLVAIMDWATCKVLA